MVSTPTTEKRWAREHDACRTCDDTDRKHHGRGLCSRCYGSHKDLIQEFIDGNRREMAMTSGGRYPFSHFSHPGPTLNFEGDTLYTYQAVLAVRRNWDAGPSRIIINADVPVAPGTGTPSPTSNRHRALILNRPTGRAVYTLSIHAKGDWHEKEEREITREEYLQFEKSEMRDQPDGTWHSVHAQRETKPIGPQISFSALEAAGLNPRKIEIVEIGDDRYIPNPTPRWPDRKDHVVGGVAFASDCVCEGGGCKKPHFYISDIDTNEPVRFRSYFLTRLPRRIEGIADAYDSLMPDEVREWDATEGNTPHRRQGDIYFLGMPPDFKTRHLPSPTYKGLQLHGTAHVATEGRKNETDFARKTVKHAPHLLQLDGEGQIFGVRRLPQHAPLRLGKIWHRTMQNLGLESFNVAANVAYID
jgi:hypothetical protein